MPNTFIPVFTDEGERVGCVSWDQRDQHYRYVTMGKVGAVYGSTIDEVVPDGLWFWPKDAITHSAWIDMIWKEDRARWRYMVVPLSQEDEWRYRLACAVSFHHVGHIGITTHPRSTLPPFSWPAFTGIA